MGCTSSKNNAILCDSLHGGSGPGGGPGGSNGDVLIGDKAAYTSRFAEGRELGQGEFGVVKLVTDNDTGDEYASKCLRKGFVFKDNTLYNPMPPENIRRECSILKSLGGQHYNMKLVGLFEDSKAIYMVTELLGGGEMLDYVADAYEGGLRTEDASRISFQLLDAINHCASHGIIHRDLKPENVMFSHGDAGADLKLIDFGCAARDEIAADGSPDPKPHATFAGTAFYIAPEVFQKSYTYKADVFSAGVVLYVLVAGYPADVLQKAFNLLQKSKRDIRKLPNMPSNMPDSYFDLLNKLLTYRPANRPSAGDVLKGDEFVDFHKELAAAAAGANGNKKRKSKRMSRTSSVVFSQTANRHKLLQSYRNFERSVTTVLATVPTNDELQELVKKLRELSQGKGTAGAIAEGDEEEEEGVEVKQEQAINADDDGDGTNADKLQVVKVGRLKELLGEMRLKEASDTLSKLPGSSNYDEFAFDVDTLEDFAKRRAASAEYAAKYGMGGGGASGENPANQNGGGGRRGMQGAKSGGFSMRGGFGGGGGGKAAGGASAPPRGGGLMKGMSFRPQPRNGGLGRKSQSVFIR